jgi:hypothetical protein
MKRLLPIAGILLCLTILYGVVKAQSPGGAYQSPSSAFTHGVASPKQGTTDTLNNTSITTEQLFATNAKIPAGTIITNQAVFATVVFDTSVSGTGSPATLRALLCPTQGSLVGCLRIYASAASTPAVISPQSGAMPLVIIGTAAAGATATVIATALSASNASSPIGQSRISSIVASVPTNADLFLQFSVQYSNTTASDSMTLTGLVLNPGPIT